MTEGKLAPCPLCGSPPVEDGPFVYCSGEKDDCVLRQCYQDETNRHVRRELWPLLTEDIKLTQEERQTVCDLIYDWGFEYSLRAKREKIAVLARRLGLDVKDLE